MYRIYILTKTYLSFLLLYRICMYSYNSVLPLEEMVDEKEHVNDVVGEEKEEDNTAVNKK